MRREAINSSFIPLLSCIHASACYKVIGGFLATSKCRGSPPAIFLSIPLGAPLAKEFNIFVNKSGNRDGKAR